MKLSTNLLKSVPIFQLLNDDELLALQSISNLQSLENDNILFYEGDSSDILHIVLQGKISVYKVNAKNKEILLKEFLPYSFIAEVSNYNHINFPASAKAIGDATVLRIDYKEFEKTFLYHPNIAPTIIKSMANKVVSLEKVISSNLVLDATQRVAKFIYENEQCFLNAKHHKMAQNLNITPVTFSRILKKFKADGILQENNNLYTVNKELLKKLFS